MALTASNSFNTSKCSAVGSSYPKYVTTSWSGTFNESTLKWDISWNCKIYGGSTSGKYVTVFAQGAGFIAKDGSGNTIASKTPVKVTEAKNGTTLISGSFSYAPNSSGDLTLALSAEFYIYTTGSSGKVTGSQTIALPTAPLASTLAITGGNSHTIASDSGSIGFTVTSRGNYYHDLYCWNAEDTEQRYLSILLQKRQINNTTYTGSVSYETILSKFPNSKLGTLVFQLITFRDSSGSDIVGTSQTINVSITIDTTKSGIKPVVSIGSISLNSGGVSGLLVAGYSTAILNNIAGSSGSNNKSGASIASYNYTVTANSSTSGGSISSSSTSLTTATLPASTSNYTLTIAVRAVDTRGQESDVVSATATVYGYSLPTITANIYRVSASGETTRDDAGDYVRIQYSSAIGASINNQNSIQSTTCTASGGASGSHNSGTWITLGVNDSATFTVTATDRITSTTRVVVVDAARFPLSLYDDQNGTLKAIFGGQAEAFKGGIGENAAFYNHPTTAVDSVVSLRNSHGMVNFGIGSTGYKGIYDSDGQYWTLRDNGSEWYTPRSLKADGSVFSESGSIWAGHAGGVTSEVDVGASCAKGRIYLYCDGSNGFKGLYLSAYGSVSGKHVIYIDANHNCTFNGNASTASADASGNTFVNSIATSGIISSISGGKTTPTSYAQKGIKYGKVANIEFEFSNGVLNGSTDSDSPGTNGTITIQLASAWKPAIGASGAGYWSSSAIIAQLDSSGSMTIRNASSYNRTFSSASPLRIAMTYILA